MRRRQYWRWNPRQVRRHGSQRTGRRECRKGPKRDGKLRGLPAAAGGVCPFAPARTPKSPGTGNHTKCFCIDGAICAPDPTKWILTREEELTWPYAGLALQQMLELTCSRDQVVTQEAQAAMSRWMHVLEATGETVPLDFMLDKAERFCFCGSPSSYLAAGQFAD